MDGFIAGQHWLLQEAQAGSLQQLPELPGTLDAGSTAHYIEQVLAGKAPTPAPIAQQVEHILHLLSQL